MQNKKNLWIGIIVILIIIAGLMFWTMTKSVPTPNQNANPQQVSTEDTTAPSIDAGVTATISYANALSKYASVHLQLDTQCKVNPSRIIAKVGDALMIDNQSALDRVAKVGSIIFNLKANSFKIIKLQGLSGTVAVDCDQSKNVASVLIQ